MKRFWIACGALSVLLLAGCGGGKEESAKKEEAAPAPAAAPIDEANAATVTGKVSFEGTAPKMATIDMSANPACAREHSTAQKIEIKNNDPTNHNIHPLPRINQEWNQSQPPKGEALIKSFPREEVMIPVKCNVHPWMRSYIGVVSHPFFAVTGEDGTFTIKGLPPGNYTIEAWHEKYGTQDLPVTVAPKESKTVDFSFKG